MHQKLDELVRLDPRYAREAYEFLFASLAHTQKLLGRNFARSVPPEKASDSSPTGEEECHVTGAQLLLGMRDLALREFGLMARTVFRMWGINQTDDLIDANLMSRTPEDNKSDFHAVYDLDEALERNYRIEIPQEADEV
jgi:uncharacterized repeat protein (TIGR04138 family)